MTELRDELAAIGVRPLPSDGRVRNERPMRRIDALAGIPQPSGERPDGTAVRRDDPCEGEPAPTAAADSSALRRGHNGRTAAGRRRRTPVPRVELVRWTNDQAIEALLATHPKTARRGMRSDLLNHCMELAYAVRDWSSSEGSMVGYSSMFLLAQRLYGEDRVQTMADLETLEKSIWRWMRRLERAHIAYFEPLVDQESGAYIGVRWRLGHPDHLPRLDSEARRSSSVGWSDGHLLAFQRRPECRSERVERRHRPRARGCGRGAPPGRFCRLAYLPGGCSSSPSSKTNRGPGAHAREGKKVSDANRRSLGLALRAALEAAGNPAGDGGEPEALLRGFGGPQARARVALAQLERDRPVYAAAAADGVPASVIGAVAFRRAYRRPSRLSARSAERLDRYGAILDRCADFGAGRTGVGALLLIDAIADALERVAEPAGETEGPPGSRAAGAAPPRPRSVGWFVTDLKRLARQWARHERARRERQAAAGGSSS